MIEYARLAFVFVVFAVIAFQDFRFGELGKKTYVGLWLACPVGFVLTLLSLDFSQGFVLWLSGFSLVVSCIAGVVLPLFGGEKFGGADGVALIFLGLSLPLAGSFVLFPLAAFMFGGVLTAVYFVFKKGKVVRVRFLPFMFVGLFLALL